MKLAKVSLFSSKREFFLLLFVSLFILIYSTLIEFNNFKILTRFDSHIVTATVVKQYTKTKLTKKGKTKTYQVLKLKAENGFNFYTSSKKSFPDSKGKKVKLELYAGEISFYEYLTGFYAYSRIIRAYKSLSLKQNLNSYIESSHTNQNIANIYQALYLASPLNYELQTTFSTLGVSHLLAISGFHLGVLSALLFFLLKYPYRFFQDRYFPYRNSKTDLFLIVSSVLLLYLLFLDSPASLLRAFVMLVIGFTLYDRGIKIISMQTLLLTAILLLSFFPRLFFSLGFFLSMAGVFYIFLFLIYFKHLSKLIQFILVPIWVYILMLPYSIVIFGAFSIYHPLSIIWTSLFTLFYPLSIFLHLIGFGYLLDSLLESFIALGDFTTHIELSFNYLILQILLSLLSVYKKNFLWLLMLYNIMFLIYAIYQVT